MSTSTGTPTGTPPLQAAGHAGALQTDNGALFIKPTNQAEVDFYTELNNGKYEDLAEKTCYFMGTLQEADMSSYSSEQVQQALAIEGTGVTANDLLELMNSSPRVNRKSTQNLVLKNCSYGYKWPNILDVKLGSILYENDADQAKKDRLSEVARTTTSGSMGMRIAGMNIQDSKLDKRIEYDRFFGRKFSKDNVIDGFRLFFEPIHDRSVAAGIAQAICDELDDIKQTLLATEVRMISASVLIIYEGNPEEFERKYALLHGGAAAESAEDRVSGDHTIQSDPEEDDEEDEEFPILTVKLIDFAHSKFTPNQGPDLNVLHGLDSLISVFDRLANEL